MINEGMTETQAGFRLRLGEEQRERLWAEPIGPGLARLVEIPLSGGAEIYDTVRYDPESRMEDEDGPSYRLVEVVQPSGYRAYLAWGIVHKGQEFPSWKKRMEQEQLAVRPGEWLNSRVRQLAIALPPPMTPLAALALFNRNAPLVEIISPLLAAHADDLERTKSDLERAVSWGAPEAELTFTIAEALEEMKRWDEAMPFWERLAHMMPTFAAARERLAINYARLGVYPHAAAEFDRAAALVEDPVHRRRLEEARDLMWERSKL